MAKKVYIGVGHGGSDPGAVVNSFVEKDLNLSIALACRDELTRHGVDVFISRTKDEEDSLREEIRECNNYDPDLAVEIHNNAGGGDGAEVFYHVGGGTGKVLAQNILDAIVASGQNSRGIKTRVDDDGSDWYGFIRETYAPAVIVECAFLDTKDVQIIDTEAERKVMGVAIAKGVLRTLGIAYIEPVVEEAVLVTVKLPMVSNGSYGDAARAAMVLLADLGYYEGALSKGDMLFGPKADAAAKAFQRDHGLDADGVVGKATWPALIGE